MNKQRVIEAGVALVIALSPAGCGEGGGSALVDATMPPGAARCAMPREVPCVDQSIAGLRLHVSPNPTAVTNQALAGGVFESTVDASGGGISPTQSYVYVRFTANGLEKVAISDEAAFSSMDWDIALRRFVIRVNGGSSGPSCVDAALIDHGALGEQTVLPAAVGWETDLFLQAPTCTLGTDEAPAGGPLTAISGYYRYDGCLIMNDAIFAVRLKTSATVALQVASYYNKAAQDYCNTMGRLPGGASGAGQFVLRWKFIAPRSAASTP